MNLIGYYTAKTPSVLAPLSHPDQVQQASGSGPINSDDDDEVEISEVRNIEHATGYRSISSDEDEVEISEVRVIERLNGNTLENKVVLDLTGIDDDDF